MTGVGVMILQWPHFALATYVWSQRASQVFSACQHFSVRPLCSQLLSIKPCWDVTYCKHSKISVGGKCFVNSCLSTQDCVVSEHSMNSWNGKQKMEMLRMKCKSCTTVRKYVSFYTYPVLAFHLAIPYIREMFVCVNGTSQVRLGHLDSLPLRVWPILPVCLLGN